MVSWRVVSLLFVGICLAVAGLTAAVLWWSGEREGPEAWMADVDSSITASISSKLPPHRAHEPVRFDPAVPSPFSAAGGHAGVPPGRRR